MGNRFVSLKCRRFLTVTLSLVSLAMVACQGGNASKNIEPTPESSDTQSASQSPESATNESHTKPSVEESKPSIQNQEEPDEAAKPKEAPTNKPEEQSPRPNAPEYALYLPYQSGSSWILTKVKDGVATNETFADRESADFAFKGLAEAEASSFYTASEEPTDMPFKDPDGSALNYEDAKRLQEALDLSRATYQSAGYALRVFGKTLEVGLLLKERRRGRVSEVFPYFFSDIKEVGAVTLVPPGLRYIEVTLASGEVARFNIRVTLFADTLRESLLGEDLPDEDEVAPKGD